MKRLLFLAVALLADVASAQTIGKSAVRYNLESSTMTYCRVNGKNGDMYGAPIEGPAAVQTSGSSATVTELVASSAPFANIAIGDILYLEPIGGPPVAAGYLVTARASSASITVDPAVNLTGGRPFKYRKTSCGTAATSGWFGISTTGPTLFDVQYNVGDFTSVDFVIECRVDTSSEPTQILPTTGGTYTNFTTPGIAARYGHTLVDPVYQECRVGMKWVGADGGTRDEISISVVKVNRPSNN